jgi:hypothetical protein
MVRLGRFLSRSLLPLFEKVLPGLKSQVETIDDVNTRAIDAAKDAGAALPRFAAPRR